MSGFLFFDFWRSFSSQSFLCAVFLLGFCKAFNPSVWGLTPTEENWFHWIWCQRFSCLIGKCRVSLCITYHRWSVGGCRHLKILLLFGHTPDPSVHYCYYKSEGFILSVPSCMTGEKWELDQHSDTNLSLSFLHWFLKFHFFPHSGQMPCAEVLTLWQSLLKEPVSGLRSCQSGFVVDVVFQNTF